MTNRIIQAAQFAHKAHHGQTRKYTGRPYIEHPARVAARVMCFPFVDEDIVCAAWMHDVLEDCLGAEIPAIFSPRCFKMVSELTNPSKQYPGLNREARKALDREHLHNCGDWVKVIKLIDRIDNVRDMVKAPSDWRCKYAAESQLMLDVLRDQSSPNNTFLSNELQQLLDEAPWL